MPASSNQRPHIVPSGKLTRENLAHLARRAYLAHRRAGAMLAAAVCFVAVVIAWLRPPLYRSEAVVVQRERGATAATSPAELKEILVGRTVLASIADELHLGASAGDLDAVEALRSRIAFVERGAGAFGISFLGRSPEEAEGVTERLARALVEQEGKRAAEQARSSKQLVAVEKARAEEELKRAEHAAATFVVEHPEFAPDAALAAGPAAARPLALERQAARVRARLAALDEAGSASGSAATPSGSKTSVEGDAAAAKRERATLKRQLGEIEREITLTKRLQRAAARRAKEPQASADRIVALESEHAKLVLAVAEARDRRERLLAELLRLDLVASSDAAGQGSPLVLIDHAYRPIRPLTMSRGLMIGAGVATALLAGFALSLFFAARDDRVHGPRDLSRIADLRLLTVVPKRVPPRGSRRARA